MIFAALIFFYQLLKPIGQEQAGKKEDVITGKIPAFPGLFPDEEGAPSAETPQQEIVGVSEPQLLQLTDFPVVSPSLNKKEDRIFFYKKDGGDLLSYDFSAGERQKIANLTIVGILEALWSPARDRAAVFYLDRETLKAFLHIGTSSVAVLPQNIEAFSWSPDGSSLAYLQRDEDELSLIRADAAGRDPRIIGKLPILEADMQWISNDKISLHTAPSGLADGFLFLFSRSAGTLTKIARGFGLEALWSTDGSLVLISSTSAEGKNIRLSLRDASGKELWSPGVAGLANKCSWASGKEIYCAVPKFISPQAVWPDDHLRGAIHTADRLIALDADKKEIREIFTEGTFDISDLVITKKKDYLFFINQRDGTPWRLKLK